MEAGLLHDALVRACLGPPCPVCGAPASLDHPRVSYACDACGSSSSMTTPAARRQQPEPEPEPEPQAAQPAVPPPAAADPAAGLPWPAPYAAYDPERRGCALVVLLPPCPPPGTLARHRPADAAVVAATALGYRTLSASGCHPDVILLLSESPQLGVNEAEEWVTPLGSVRGDPVTVQALLESSSLSSRRLTRLPMASNEPGGAAAHAVWVWSLAAAYDCERRDGLLAPRLVHIGVPTELEPSVTEELATLLASTIDQVATRRFAVVGTTGAPTDAPTYTASISGERATGGCAAAVAQRCAELLGLCRATPLGPLAFCFRALPTVVPSQMVTPKDHRTDNRGGAAKQLLFRWETGSTWVSCGPWHERHGPHACTDWRASWGSSSQIHMHSSEWQQPECLHAVWAPPVVLASDRDQPQGVVLCVTGAGAGAGPHGAFGPFCLFSTMAAELPQSGVGVMTLIYPNWAVGKQSVAILAVREATVLLKALTSNVALVLLGWSLGGAASIEAAGRLVTDERASSAGGRGLRVRGVITLASQAAGLLKVGNGRGRINSVRFALRILGEAKVPLLAMHGSEDECVRPNQTDLLADFWASKSFVIKKPLVGDDHGVAQALPHVLEGVAAMLACK